MILVDTSVWIDWIALRDTEQTGKLHDALETEDVFIGDIVSLEVLQGARDELHARKIERMLADCLSAEMMDKRLATVAADNFRLLRGKGITIRKTVDLIIGTWCIHNNCPLLHNDRDFLPMVEHLGLQQL